MKRNALSDLIKWKNDPERKPLVLRGARQVGKTWLMREFGQSCYEHFVYFNFDEEDELKSIFASNKNPQRIIELLSLIAEEKIQPEKTLILFDEVQECPEALNSLKYFREKANDYHIIAAGSLLGTLLAQPKSYPVGMVNLLDLYPLTFDEFYEITGQKIFISATPGAFERERSAVIAEQIIRPTGLLDPDISVRPTDGQMDDLIGEIQLRVERNERVLVTTLTRKMAENLTDYLESFGIKVRYLHYDVDTIERMEIIRDLRLGEFDVLVGINLLREGLDIPEVSLVAILDADKEGFLRSETSLIQTIGRAARNASGMVIMYADSVTPSMENAIRETMRRREKQMAYNEQHGIIPQTIHKDVRDVLEISTKEETEKKTHKKLSRKERDELIAKLTAEMHAAANILEFEHAAYLRDRIEKLKSKG